MQLALSNSAAGPQLIKQRNHMSGNSTPRHLPKRNENTRLRRNLHMSTGAQFLIGNR